MSASAILDAVKNQLAGSAFFGAKNVGLDYGVLEAVDGSAVVVEVSGLDWIEQTFGGVSQATWTISIRGFSKDTGDPARIMARSNSIMDTASSCIRSDPTFSSAVNRTSRLRMSRPLPPGGFIVAGGATWQEVPMEIDVEEWPDG